MGTKERKGTIFEGVSSSRVLIRLFEYNLVGSLDVLKVVCRGGVKDDWINADILIRNLAF